MAKLTKDDLVPLLPADMRRSPHPRAIERHERSEQELEAARQDAAASVKEAPKEKAEDASDA